MADIVPQIAIESRIQLIRGKKVYQGMKMFDTIKKISLCILGAAIALYADSGLDTFGITRFYATKPGTREWNSAHWNNGHARLVQYAGDPYDPTGWTDNHSSSSGDSSDSDRPVPTTAPRPE